MSTKNQTHPLAPLEPWLNDPDVTDIMVDSYSKVYVRRRSLGCRFVEVFTPFRGNEHLMEVINTTIAPMGREIDPWSPFVDVCLPDGSYLNVMIPPLTSVGPALTIRKSPKRQLTVTDLLRFGFWTEEIVEFLRACTRSRLNIVVSGGTASGKTTVLTIIAGMIPADERIITIEPAGCELRLPTGLKHVLPLQGRSPNIVGKDAVTAQHLVANALQMRPDRIIVSEVRGAEVLDLLQAMNTGHKGMLITTHANSPRDVLVRLERMATSTNPSPPLLNVRRQIASAIDLITYQARMRDGKRKILKVTEVLGMQGDTVELQDIFEFRQTGFEEDKVTGHFAATGYIPGFLGRVKAAGIEMPMDLFAPQ